MILGHIGNRHLTGITFGDFSSKVTSWKVGGLQKTSEDVRRAEGLEASILKEPRPSCLHCCQGLKPGHLPILTIRTWHRSKFFHIPAFGCEDRNMMPMQGVMPRDELAMLDRWDLLSNKIHRGLLCHVESCSPTSTAIAPPTNGMIYGIRKS